MLLSLNFLKSVDKFTCLYVFFNFKKSLFQQKNLIELIIIQVDFLSIVQPLVFIFQEGRKTSYIIFRSISRWLPRLFSISPIDENVNTFLNGSLIIQSKWCSHRASGDFLIHVLQANVLLISQPYRSINESIRAISAALLRMYLLDLCCRSIKTSRLQCRNLFFVVVLLHLDGDGRDACFPKTHHPQWTAAWNVVWDN